MPAEACENLFRAALARVIEQVNAREFGDFNEATIQHHLAMALHLDALEQNALFRIILENRVARENGEPFPKKQSNKADIDVFFVLGEDQARCAIELKVFKRINQREPNNRYDAYADLANLETYLGEHCDIGFLVVLTNHPHYYDADARPLSAATADFSLRDGHRYLTGQELSYDTANPYGPNLVLENDHAFDWSNQNHPWRLLVVKVEAN